MKLRLPEGEGRAGEERTIELNSTRVQMCGINRSRDITHTLKAALNITLHMFIK